MQPGDQDGAPLCDLFSQGSQRDHDVSIILELLAVQAEGPVGMVLISALVTAVQKNQMR